MEQQRGDRTVNSKRANTHVDSDTLPSKSTGSAYAVNIVFTISVCDMAAR